MVQSKHNEKTDFRRNVMILMTGSGLSQIIPIVIGPILTRLYSPEEFGVFTLFMSIVIFFSSFSTLKYELAINLQKDEDSAVDLLMLSIWLSFLISSLLFVLFGIFNNEITDALGNEDIEPWLYLIPFSVFLCGLHNSLVYWNNRKKEFKVIAKNRVFQSLTSGVSQLSLAPVFSKYGLASGFVIGQLFATAFLCNLFFKTNGRSSIKVGIRDLVLKLKKYRKFAIYQAPSSGLEVVSSQLPVFLLMPFFGAAVVGYYSISQKVIRTPIQVIASSVSDVFRQNASEMFIKTGNIRDMFLTVVWKLVSISVFPFVLFLIYAPDIFMLVFGEGWYIAGEYARIMAPMFWMSFVVGPVSIVFVIAEKQEYDFIIQVVLTTFTVISILVGYYWYDSVEVSLIFVTIVYCIKYTFELILSYIFCKKKA